MALRIVIISPYQFRLHRGVERFTYSLANRLAMKGAKVTVYAWSPLGSNVNWGEWNDNVKIRKVPGTRYFQSALAVLFYKIWLRTDRPDVIALNFLYHGEHRLPPHKKYIYILNSPASLVPARYRFIRHKMDRFADLKFVAVSNMVKREAIPFLGGSRISIISNGVDTDLFKPQPGKTSAENNTFKIITTAALEERKGMQHMLRFLGGLNNQERKGIRYHIYGEGSYQAELEGMIRHYQLEEMVSIFPPVNNLHEVLPGYDLFCLMSRGEAMPLAPLEAMACGLPVLTSNLPPYDEFISPELGLAVNPENHAEILRFIQHCRNKTAMKKMSAAAREKSRHFSWESITESYMNLIINLKEAGV